MIGSQLLHYQINAKVGEGGMGEVYRARDTKLDRDVAIKVLPAVVSTDAERHARFQREAKVLASLNHPNIAAIYGLEEVQGRSFLVMELVEGDDLSSRIEQGAISPRETLEIALQIVNGLEAAHEKGIVHRDLKPANLKITPEGQVKILDFGLARAYAGDQEDPDLEHSPTITAAMTMAGTILGTAAYMSPEQARGKNVDRRADIWALGVIVWEMLTGLRLFAGETISDTLAMVMRDPVDLERLPADTPPSLRWILSRCLERDPRERLRDVGEARWMLSGGVLPMTDTSTVRATRTRAIPVWAVAALILLAAGAAFWIGRRTTSEPGPVDEKPMTRFALASEGELQYLDDAPRLSPDGRRVVYASDGVLWLHDLGELHPQRLRIESETARAPFWAPDGKQFGYFSVEGSGSSLWRHEIGPGRSQLVSQLDGGLVGGVGATWTDEGRIFFSMGGTGIFEVSARGGDPVEVIAVGGNVQDLHEPWMMRDDGGLLMVEHRIGSAGGGNTIVLERDGQRSELLTESGHRIWNVVYSPTGHVLYHRTGDNEGIWALPVSLDGMRPAGDPFLVIADATLPDVSADGDLVYVEHNDAGGQLLAWVDPVSGTVERFDESYEDLQHPGLSPDGRQLIVTITEGNSADLWLFDLAHGARQQIPSTPGIEIDMDWLDGEHIVFALAGQDSVFVQNVIRGTPPRLVCAGDRPSVISADQVLVRRKASSSADPPGYYAVAVDGSGPSVPVVLGDTVFDAEVNPARDLLATIQRDPGGGDRVFISRYPDVGGSWAVPSRTASWLRWGLDGRLYWREGPRRIMVVDVTLDGAAVRVGEPQVAAETPGWKGWGGMTFAPDAKGRLLQILVDRENTEIRRIVVVQNPASLFADQPR